MLAELRVTHSRQCRTLPDLVRPRPNERAVAVISTVSCVECRTTPPVSPFKTATHTAAASQFDQLLDDQAP